MTTPSLHSVPVGLRPPLRRPAPSPRPESVAAVRAARVQDVLEPYLCDYASFVDLVREELRDPRSRPRVLEFGCGSGRLTVSLLATRPDIEYHGFDRSPSRVDRAIQRLAEHGLRQRVQFTAPFPLDARAIGETLQGHRVDFLILPRFLQTVPLCGTDGGGLHRVSFLAFCRQMVKPGGRIFAIEDVYGESADDHAFLSLESRGLFRARLVADLEHVRRALAVADPALGARMGRLPGDPALLQDLLDRVRRPDAQLLPLTAWQGMLDHLGFAYRVTPHESHKALYLFTIRC